MGDSMIVMDAVVDKLKLLDYEAWHSITPSRHQCELLSSPFGGTLMAGGAAQASRAATVAPWLFHHCRPGGSF